MNISVPTKQKARLENIVVTTGKGKVYNLGKPSSILFRFRLLKYKLIRKIRG